MGARNGTFAALFVASGASGVPGSLTGDVSYLSAFAENARPEVLADGLGSRHEILAASIKKWCVGSPIQAALDSLTALMVEHALTADDIRSEEHTSELQSLMRISYAVFCLKKKNTNHQQVKHTTSTTA